MNESEWVALMVKRIKSTSIGRARRLSVKSGLRLSYGNEIASYGETPAHLSTEFQTDVAVIESDSQGRWKPRVVIEAKLESVTTHDAITYSQKAASHKAVHPYLRYGIMLGDRGTAPLPGRLYRHGERFDFMISFRSPRPTASEMARFERLLRAEIRASRTLESLLYESRKRSRDRYTVLHRGLRVE